ncbi:MAG: hypothetical protein RR251_07320 [Hydrogenoanaerobacterium sp.]
MLIFNLACCKKNDAQESAFALENQFSSDVAVKYKDISASLSMQSYGAGCCKFVFLSPEALNGMSFEFTPEAINIGYKTLHTSLSPQAMPKTAICKQLITVLKAAAGEGVNKKLADGMSILSGALAGSEFIVRVDKKSGKIISLEVPNEKFEAEFSDFCFIK